MKVSVVIPVYNEEKYIEACLRSILANTVQPYEIIVADGGSKDKTKELVQKFPEVTLANNPKRTAASGRNVGIACAAGDIIAFTDGDCLVEKHWIESIDHVFEDGSVDGIGGKVIAHQAENEYEQFWNHLAWSILMNFGDEPYRVKNRTMNDAFVTANCAYRRKLLEELNGFDEWFGNNAEDIDLSWRALKQGAHLLYYPDAVIYAHGVTTMKGIKAKSFRNGISSCKLQKRYGGHINYDWNIYKMWFKTLIKIFRWKKMEKMQFAELSWHLLGKYYGSFKYHVFNI